MISKLLARSRGAVLAFGRERIGTFRLLTIVRFLQWPVRALTRPIVSRTRRDLNLIAFGADGGRFADNAAYLYLHMVRSADVRCVWISPSAETVELLRSMGLPAARRWSREGISVARRAGWYVFTSYRQDINTWLSDGAIAFDLWHGVGVKRIQRDRHPGSASGIYHAPDASLTAKIFADDRRAPDWVLSTSSMTTEIFSRSFGIEPERCVEIGYPRNDHLVSSSPPPPDFVDPELAAQITSAKFAVAYVPTFRDNMASIPGGAPVIGRMAEIVASQGGVLVFKAHDATSLAIDEGTDMVVLPKSADLNAYLGQCDVLVSDYSSVVSDFLLTRRPTILFWPDLDEYSDDRGFHTDPAEVLQGLIARTRDELYAALSDLENLSTSPRTDELIERWWTSPTANAAEQIAQFIQKGEQWAPTSV